MYDKKAKMRDFSEGCMMLVRRPDLVGKLEDCWDGPLQNHQEGYPCNI